MKGLSRGCGMINDHGSCGKLGGKKSRATVLKEWAKIRVMGHRDSRVPVSILLLPPTSIASQSMVWTRHRTVIASRFPNPKSLHLLCNAKRGYSRIFVAGRVVDG